MVQVSALQVTLLLEACQAVKACPVYRRNKKQYKQHFQRGAASSELAESPLTGKDAKKTGTRVSFLYDKTIFSSR